MRAHPRAGSREGVTARLLRSARSVVPDLPGCELADSMYHLARSFPLERLNNGDGVEYRL
jgi:hypothetical protein